MTELGKIAVIGNPAAQNGAGALATRQVGAALSEQIERSLLDIFFTVGPKHAAHIAKTLDVSYDTVLCVGGDGIVHETLNGIMLREPRDRPRLGVIPVGSGNDYAESIGMPYAVEEAIAQVLKARETSVDIGICNQEYFAETLSFGLDAAIALDTQTRRKRIGRTGTRLYLESGIDQLLHHLEAYSYTGMRSLGANNAEAGNRSKSMRTDVLAPEAAFEGSAYLCAVQLGPTYGGHFRVCPDARINDGLLDVCIAHPPLSTITATGIFLLAKNGRHTRFKQIEIFQTERLSIAFDREPPGQIDGERIRGKRFDIGLLRNALSVLTGPNPKGVAPSG